MMFELPNVEPDKIEQQIISAVSEAIDQPDMKVDTRSLITRSLDRLSSTEAERRDDALKKRWKAAIVQRLAALGNRLSYHSESEKRGAPFRGGWMYDVI